MLATLYVPNARPVRPILLVGLFLASGLVAIRYELSVGVTLAGLLLIVGLVSLSADQRRAKAQRIREAIRDAGLSMKEAAALMQFHSAADLNHMLDDDERKLDAWRLEMLPDDFHAHLALLELRDRGLPQKIRLALKVIPALPAMKERA